MKDVAVGGRTVLLVSHNMSSILSLCSRCLLLSQGRVEMDDTAKACTQAYLQQRSKQGAFERLADPGSRARIASGEIVADDQDESQRMLLKLQIWSAAAQKTAVDLRLSEGAGNSVGFGSLGTLDARQMVDLQPGSNVLRISFSTAQLANGSYSISLDLNVPYQEYLDRAENCLSFDLERASEAGGNRVLLQNWGYGSLRIPLSSVPDESKTA
jgi:lipopolysaccharide transport system ATP-binding protein